MERRGGNIAPRGFAVENRPTDIERPRGGIGLCAGATVLPRPAMKENVGRIEARRNDMEVSGARIDARGALASSPDERLSARRTRARFSRQAVGAAARRGAGGGVRGDRGAGADGSRGATATGDGAGA